MAYLNLMKHSGKQGTKRSLLVEGKGLLLGCVVAGANRNDSLLLRPTLEQLRRIEDLSCRCGSPCIWMPAMTA